MPSIANKPRRQLEVEQKKNNLRENFLRNLDSQIDFKHTTYSHHW